MDEKRVTAFNALPQPSSCRLIDFDDVQVIPGTILRTYFLIVKGTKPWVTMDVGLHPLPYATRPDFTPLYGELSSLPDLPANAELAEDRLVS